MTRRVAVVASLLALALPGAAAAAAPTATTGTVSAVSSTSATVNGAVDPNGQTTSWYFEYGPSTQYGSTTATSSAGSGTSAVGVSAKLAALAPGTTYHYRLVAQSGGGTSRGVDGIFTTTSPPDAATGGATAIGPSSATLQGSVNPKGRATTWHFEFGTSTSYGSTTTERSAGSGTSDVAVEAPISGLSPGATYHYRLVATSDAGTTRGGDRTFTAAGAPGASTGSASGVGPTSATLSGTVDPNAQSTSWYFEYGTSTSYGSRTGTQNAGSGTAALNVAASVAGLQPATTYHFRVVATNAAGTTRGGDQTFRTSLAPDARTGPPTGVGASFATLTGSVDPRGRSTSWYFEYGTDTRYGSRTATRSVGSQPGDHNVGATVTGLRAGVRYHYRLVAASDAGTTRGADQSFVTATVPAVATGGPSAVAATTASLTGTINPNGQPTSWYFEYGTSTRYGSRTPAQSAGSGTAAIGVSAPVGGLRPRTGYHYRLVATSAAGTVRAADRGFTTSAGLRAGAATGGATAIGPASATLTGSVSPNGQGATWYFEYGTSSAYGSRTSAGSTSTTGTVVTRVTDLEEGTTYHFRLVATNAAGTTTAADATFTTPLWPRTPNGDVVRCTVVGTTGDDVLRGTSHKDVICGLGGNDAIAGDGGSDVIYAGAGNDRITGGLGNDVVFAGPGDDVVHGGPGRDTIDGGPGRDALFGDAWNDVLLGRTGADTLVGGSGRDRLVGGAGNDTILAADGSRDVVDGGPGRDRARVDRGRDELVSATGF